MRMHAHMAMSMPLESEQHTWVEKPTVVSLAQARETVLGACIAYSQSKDISLMLILAVACL